MKVNRWHWGGPSEGTEGGIRDTVGEQGYRRPLLTSYCYIGVFMLKERGIPQTGGTHLSC
jgi:hypothetical protein